MQQKEEFSIQALRFFQAYRRRLKEQSVAILEATTEYYLQHGQWDTGYENLVGYLNSPPYSQSIFLHGLAGKIAWHLYRNDPRKIVREKYLKRALNHFDGWLGHLLESGQTNPEHWNCLPLYLEALLANGTTAKATIQILRKLVMRLPHILQLHFLLIERLMEAQDHGAILTQMEATTEELLVVGGVSFPPSLMTLAETQLKTRRMRLSEYCRWLRLHTLFLILTVEQAPLDLPSTRDLFDRLGACQVQFLFLGHAEEWNRLSCRFPKLDLNHHR